MNLLDWLAIPGGVLMLVVGVALWRRGDRAGTALPQAGPPEDCLLQIPALGLLMCGALLVIGEPLIWFGVIPG